jgi:hypothetical protein
VACYRNTVVQQSLQWVGNDSARQWELLSGSNEIQIGFQQKMNDRQKYEVKTDFLPL